MDLYAACDICGHRYVVPDERKGRRTKCKSCGASFDISEHNYYYPDTPEIQDDNRNEEEPQPGAGAKVLGLLGNAATAIVTISLLIWMGSLFFRSPQDVVASRNLANSGFNGPGVPSLQRTDISRPSFTVVPPPQSAFTPQPSVPWTPPTPTAQPSGPPVAWTPPTPNTAPPINPGELNRQMQQRQQEVQQRMQQQHQRIQQRMQGGMPNRPSIPSMPNRRR